MGTTSASSPSSRAATTSSTPSTASTSPWLRLVRTSTTTITSFLGKVPWTETSSSTTKSRNFIEQKFKALKSFKSSRHGKVVGAKRPRDIEEDATLAAHVLLIIAGASNTGSAVHWGRVGAALGLSVPGQSDVATLAPAGSPAVPHNPVIALGSVSAVANKLHSVVESNVAVIGTSRVNSRAVSTPSGSVHSDTKRTNLSKMGHNGILVIGGKSVVASDSHNRSSVGEVIHVVPSLGGRSRSVWVVRLEAWPNSWM